MRAISCLSLDEGISTVSWAAVIPLRIRVRKSAMGSVIDMERSPARLGHAGDHAVVRELAQADPAEAELAVHRARPATPAAARVLAGLVLGGSLLANPLGGLRHAVTPLRVGCVIRIPWAGRRVRTACPVLRAARTPRGRRPPWW